MKTCKIFFVAVCLISLVKVQAQDQGEMMKKWQEYMTPGQNHQILAKMAGDWKAEVTSYQGGQEMKAEGTAKYEMILGGRYLKSSYSATMMGMPMEGMGLDAFDNATKEFISIWVDNMGTGVVYMKGTLDEKTKTITYHGSMVDPMTSKEMKMKTVNTMVDDNKTIFDMFTEVDGKDVKNMTIVYTRVK